MSVPHGYSFTRYLAAKKPIDDRSLNAWVWDGLETSLRLLAQGRPAAVLELGAGIGTMVERAWERGLAPLVDYTAIDSDPACIALARQRLSGWARRGGIGHDDDIESRSRLRGPQADWSVELCQADAFEFLRQANRSWDLLLAHAFVDLIDLPTRLPFLLSALREHGLFYFSLAFDGATILEPPIDPQLDALIERLYHQTMDQRMIDGHPSGDSCTGRHLPAAIRAAGGEVLRLGASDWVVHPRGHAYPGDEAYFLHFIVHTIAGALRSSPEIAPKQLNRWSQARHSQIERGELTYIAHQLDVLGQKS